MTWGPHDNKDMWNKPSKSIKPPRLKGYSPKKADLHYLDGNILKIDLTDKGWNWRECHKESKRETVSYDYFGTSFEAILDYEETR